MPLRNPETIYRITDRIQGNLVNLKMIVKSQRPIEEFTQKIEQTEELITELISSLDREGSPLRNG
jgi:flagellin-specific chaperone FliS|tara:strand:+ start:1257 stop:1451 length:195 start_codon:yes stop_codon:yes gene_type:complete